MKRLSLNKYSVAAIFLFAAGVAYIAIALIINPGEITTSAFVIGALICVMIGIFTLTFSAGDPVNPWLVGILPAQGSINLCRMMHHLGIQGNAYFLPPSVTGEGKVMQFNQSSTYDGRIVFNKGLFRERGPAGIVTTPSCDLLIEDFRKRNALVIPDKEEELACLIRETIEDFFKFAPRVSVQWDGSKVTITFHEYPYIDGCKAIAQKSSQCCAMSPCPACSLCGALIAEGLDRVVTLDRCSESSSSKDITAVFSISP
jgi:hypothetical protein